MKTFKEFLKEQEHYGPYRDWGLVHPSGKIITGNDHPEAQDHGQLFRRTNTNPDDKFTHYSRYYVTKKSGELGIQTNHNKKSLGGAMKALDKLPISHTGKIEHHHDSAKHGHFDSTPPSATYNKLKQLHDIAP